VPSLAARFQTTFDLHEAGVEMMRLKLRRLHPAEPESEIHARLLAWMQRRDDEIPDTRKIAWPRS
jgi:uncharacterized protein YaeQ